MKNDAPFQFIETDDRRLIAQYIELRRRVYRNEYPWLPEDFGFADQTDRASRIVLAMLPGQVVAGGGRLTISTPANPRRLPLEEAEFQIQNYEDLNHLNLSRSPYGEVSRMVIDPEWSRGFSASAGLGDALCALAAHHGLDAVFCICPKAPARLNEIHAKKRGVAFHRYLELPTVFGRDMRLCAFTGLLNVYGALPVGAA
jgi:hypothetical protein